MLVNQKNELSKRKNPSKTDEHDTNPRAGKLLDSDVIVEYEEEQWIVKSKGAKRQATILIQKEAIEKGKQVAQNKESTLFIYKKMGQKKRNRLLNICKGVVTKIVSQPLMFETMVFLCQLRTISHNIYKTGRAVFEIVSYHSVLNGRRKPLFIDI